MYILNVKLPSIISWTSNKAMFYKSNTILRRILLTPQQFICSRQYTSSCKCNKVVSTFWSFCSKHFRPRQSYEKNARTLKNFQCIWNGLKTGLVPSVMQPLKSKIIIAGARKVSHTFRRRRTCSVSHRGVTIWRPIYISRDFSAHPFNVK